MLPKCDVDMKRVTIDRIDVILIGVFILALWAILAIQLKVVPTINVGWETETTKSINEVLLNFSYSYIAASIFYGLTTRLTAYRRKKKLLPVIRKRVEQIGKSGIYYILLEFARESGYKDYKSPNNTAKILETKQLLDEMPFFKEIYGVRKTYLAHVWDEGQKIKEMVSSLLIQYKEEMTVEQILLLEDIPDMYIFRLVDIFCSCLPAKDDKGSKAVFIEEFCKLHEKYLEVERAFGIEKKDAEK